MNENQRNLSWRDSNPVLALDMTPLWGRQTTGIQRVIREVTPYLAAAAARRNWDIVLVRHSSDGLEELSWWTGEFSPTRVAHDLERIATGELFNEEHALAKLSQFLRRTSRAIRQAKIGPVGYAPLARNVRGIFPKSWRQQMRSWLKRTRSICTTSDAYLSFAAGVLPSNPPPNMPPERAVFVLHDLIPLHFSHFCNSELAQAFTNNLSHLAYHRQLSRGRIVTASQHVAQDIRELFHSLTRQRVQVDLVKWGYDSQKFYCDPNPIFRHNLGIPPDALLVTAVSTQDPRKRFAEIQAAVSQMNAYAVFVGQGEPRREGNAIYLGYASDEVVRQAYSCSDVVVNWSAAEGFGLSTIEALACGGRVVVPPDNPVSIEVGREHVVVAPTADVPGLCSAIAAAAELPRPRPDLSQFSWANSASILESLLWPEVETLRRAG